MNNLFRLPANHVGAAISITKMANMSRPTASSFADLRALLVAPTAPAAAPIAINTNTPLLIRVCLCDFRLIGRLILTLILTSSDSVSFASGFGGQPIVPTRVARTTRQTWCSCSTQPRTTACLAARVGFGNKSAQPCAEQAAGDAVSFHLRHAK